MYAIVFDGELVAQGIQASEVLKVLKSNKQGYHVEIASYSADCEAWIPVCPDQFIN